MDIEECAQNPEWFENQNAERILAILIEACGRLQDTKLLHAINEDRQVRGNLAKLVNDIDHLIDCAEFELSG